MENRIKSIKPAFYFTRLRWNSFIVFIGFMLLSNQIQSQIENVVVETYYISDAQDATDTLGGHLEIGSKTYRIYLDLETGVKLRKIYGDQNHPLIFNSTESFFNNKVDGQSFGKDFTKTRLQENTVALDSWLTLGQTTRVSTKTAFGVLKVNDDDGSFIGGTNNDGGSEAISTGLLINSDPEAGIPLTTADGMDTLTSTPEAWADYGIRNSITQADSSIFGSIITGNHFESRNAYLTNSGVTGVDASLNHILIAQLTTKGTLSFEINIELEVNSISGPQIIKLVARDSILNQGEQLSAFLTYPQTCGCQDSDYLEYSPAYGCNIQDSCKTLLALGCMDPLACNFDPNANFNIQELCCYVGYCNDLDISVLCPNLGIDELNSNTLRLYPNPTESLVTAKSYFALGIPYQAEIYDFSGRMLKSIYFPNLNSGAATIDFSSFSDGIYSLRFISSENIFSGRVIKQ